MENSEYFKDQRIKEISFEEQKNKCNLGKHFWSNLYCTPIGLARECKGCNKIEYFKDPYFCKLTPEQEEQEFKRKLLEKGKELKIKCDGVNVYIGD